MKRTPLQLHSARFDPGPARRIVKCVDCSAEPEELHDTPFGPMCRTCAGILAEERRLERSE